MCLERNCHEKCLFKVFVSGAGITAFEIRMTFFYYTLVVKIKRLLELTCSAEQSGLRDLVLAVEVNAAKIMCMLVIS